MNEALITGRAATAIYLVLRHSCPGGGKVLVPANVCYAAIFPIYYAGMQPVFVDVNPQSGNVTYEAIRAAVLQEAPAAAMIVHMYGNPVQETPRIADFLRSEGVVCIEDCAAAMGASILDGRTVGSFGDYAVHSTGYAKTIDLGFGGLLITNLGDEIALRRLEETLPMYNEEFEEEDAFFSKMYRALRNGTVPVEFQRKLFMAAREIYRPNYLFRLQEQQKDEVKQAIKKLDVTIQRRRENQSRYRNAFEHFLPSENIYTFSKGAVPWRFTLLLNPDIRHDLISFALTKKLPISDWYPNIAPLFTSAGSFPNADWMGERIVNFPIPAEEQQIQHIAETIQFFFQKRAF
ncbi:MAG: DegT/DnrJ/EryC1/StrS family aminotransferase [Eggerthellaceae bacterium]|jgi:dTDP-4-amino-4,6-dideoxygalactose transaminase